MELEDSLPKFTSAPQLFLSSANSIQSIPPQPNSWRSILILSSHLRLGLPSGFFPSTLPHMRYVANPSHTSRFYYPHNIGWTVQIIQLLIMQFLLQLLKFKQMLCCRRSFCCCSMWRLGLFCTQSSPLFLPSLPLHGAELCHRAAIGLHSVITSHHTEKPPRQRK